MKTLLFGLLFIASSVYSQELNYAWKAGGIYSFNANIADDITTSVMGMNVKEKYITTIDFHSPFNLLMLQVQRQETFICSIIR
jgi:hypothetical protein